MLWNQRHLTRDFVRQLPVMLTWDAPVGQQNAHPLGPSLATVQSQVKSGTVGTQIYRHP